MSHPSRATYQQQGPATNCRIGDLFLGWQSCTAYAGAMGVDKSSLNTKQPSGCSIRRMTGDTVGGLTLPQVASVILAEYGIRTDVYTGSRVVSPFYLAVQLQAGRGAVAQGNAIAMVGTRWRCTAGAVNHAVWINEVRGGKVGEPAEALVYDPAADGRSTVWGKADQGPSWWPWSLVKEFVSELHPWGDTDSRKLGPGKVYCAVFPDTEPHAHLTNGASRARPFPDRTRGKKGATAAQRRVRKGPGFNYVGIPGQIVAVGELFEAYQYTTDGKWAGNHDGNGWVSTLGLAYIGGAT